MTGGFRAFWLLINIYHIIIGEMQNERQTFTPCVQEISTHIHQRDRIIHTVSAEVTHTHTHTHTQEEAESLYWECSWRAQSGGVLYPTRIAGGASEPMPHRGQETAGWAKSAVCTFPLVQRQYEWDRKWLEGGAQSWNVMALQITC